MNIKAVLKRVWDDVVVAVQHPSTVKKSVAAGAATVLADIAAFSFVLPHVPVEVAAAVTAVQTFATAVVVFLSPANVGR